MADEVRRYLDYDGLAHLVELLTNRIQAVGGDGKYLPLTGGTLTGDLTVETKMTANQVIVGDDLTAYAVGASGSLDCGGSVSFTKLGDTADPASEAGVLTVGTGGLVSRASLSALASALGVAAPGVYAAYVDNESLVNGICAPSDWDGGYRTFCGGLIVGAGWNILVAPDWSSTRALTNGFSNDSRQYVTGGEAYAAADFDGRGNTTAEIDAGTGSSSSCGIYYADTYSCGGVGPGKWWVPSAGELMEVMRNWDALQGLFDVVYPSRVTTVFTRLWSSTGYSYNSAWTVGTDGSLGWENKYGNGDYVYPVLPVSSFRW